eukprot:2331378-Rhodomonas_salina.1
MQPRVTASHGLPALNARARPSTKPRSERLMFRIVELWGDAAGAGGCRDGARLNRGAAATDSCQ